MDLTVGSIPKKIIKLVIPLILMNLLQILFNAADIVVVGRFAGSICVAAVGATTALINLFLQFFIGLSSGAAIVVAQEIGAKGKDSISKAVHTSMAFALICGAILSLAGLLLARKLLAWMGTPEDIIDLAALYLKIYFSGAVFNIVYNFGAGVLRANGETRKPLYYLTISGIANVILNIIFVSAFRMDVDGVALATVMSQAISCVLVVRDLMKRNDAVRLEVKKLKLNGRLLSRMLRIGIPSGITQSTFSIGNVLVASVKNSFGSAAVAGSSAAASIQGVVSAFHSGFCQAQSSFAGQNYGAGDMARVRKSRNVSMYYMTVSALVLSVLMIVFARPLVGIYIVDSEAAIQAGITQIVVGYWANFVNGVSGSATATLQGCGKSYITMITNIFCTCILRILWIFLVMPVPQFHTFQMLYRIYPITWIVESLVLAIVYPIYMKKTEEELKIRQAEKGMEVVK